MAFSVARGESGAGVDGMDAVARQMTAGDADREDGAEVGAGADNCLYRAASI